MCVCVGGWFFICSFLAFLKHRYLESVCSLYSLSSRGGYRNFERRVPTHDIVSASGARPNFLLERGQFCKHLIIWDTIMFGMYGTKVWFTDELVK